MRPLLMLFVGSRGQRLSDMCRPLSTVADVVVTTSQDILDERVDALEEAEFRHAVIAPGRGDIVGHALAFAAEHRVDGTVALGEDTIEEAAVVASELGLPGQPVHTMARFRDKFAQRRALADAGVPAPAYAAVTGPEQGRAALDRVGLPAICKPTRGSGGARTFVIAAPEHLDEVLEEVFGGAVADGEGGEDRELILESLLIGQPREDLPGLAPYVSVESLALRGEVTHLAVTDRFPLSPPALETGMVCPSTLPARAQRDAMEVADRALAALGFEHGLAHTELMLTAEGPKVIEVNARAGGAVPYLMSLASDLDLTREAGRVALGLKPAEPPTFDRHAVFIAPQHPVGVTVERVEGLDEVAGLPGVRMVIPLSMEGTSTADFEQTMIAAVLAVADSGQEAVRLWQEVMRLVRVEYASGVISERHRRAPGSTSALGDGGAVVEALPRTMRVRDSRSHDG